MLADAIKVCCGPRCGAEPNHRAVYAAVEAACAPALVVPAMCQGHCTGGVTVVRADKTVLKLQTAQQAGNHDLFREP